VERYHSYLDAPLQHVYLAGDVAAVSCAASKFQQLGDFQVRILEPSELDMSWHHSGDVPGTDLAATLGTAMALYTDTARQQGPNLIESALAQQREPMRPILIRSLIPVGGVRGWAVPLSGGGPCRGRPTARTA
jgi:hypothetical protein